LIEATIPLAAHTEAVRCRKQRRTFAPYGVEDFVVFVDTQSEIALRRIADGHPYCCRLLTGTPGHGSSSRSELTASMRSVTSCPAEA